MAVIQSVFAGRSKAERRVLEALYRVGATRDRYIDAEQICDALDVSLADLTPVVHQLVNTGLVTVEETDSQTMLTIRS